MSRDSLTKSKSYSASAFTRDVLICPSCGGKQEGPVEVCKQCGFTGQQTVALFGLSAPPMDAIVDEHNLFTPSEKKSLRRGIIRFEKQFPQIHLCFLRTELPSRYDIKVFAFWYFNVAPLRVDETPEDRRWSILLVQDPVNRRIATICGYSIEAFISEEKWDALLLSVINEWQAEGRSKALTHYIHKLSDLLYKSYIDCAQKISLQS